MSLFRCYSVRLLGEPCDPAILIQHYGKLSSSVHTEAGMDFKSESAAIYVLVGSHVCNYFQITNKLRLKLEEKIPVIWPSYKLLDLQN